MEKTEEQHEVSMKVMLHNHLKAYTAATLNSYQFGWQMSTNI